MKRITIWTDEGPAHIIVVDHCLVIGEDTAEWQLNKEIEGSVAIINPARCIAIRIENIKE